MKRSAALPCSLTTLAMAVLLYLLRLWECRTGFDAEGFPVWSAPSHWVLIAACVVCLIVLAVLGRARLEPGTQFERMPVYVLVNRVLGAVAIACGCAALLYAKVRSGHMLTGAVFAIGLLAALCLLVEGFVRAKGKPVPNGLSMVPYIFLVVMLCVRFREWSNNPVVLAYCYMQLATIFSAAGLYQLSSIGFARAAVRSPGFWLASAVCFCAIALCGAPDADRLLYCGLMLCAYSGLLHLPQIDG